MICKKALRREIKILVLIYLLVTIPIWLYGERNPNERRVSQAGVETRRDQEVGQEDILEESSPRPTPDNLDSGSSDNRDLSDDSFIGLVSWYGYESCVNKENCRTADNSAYNPEEYTCACWNTYPFGTRFRVSRIDNSKSIIVVCTDRGNFRRLGRFLDLSKAAFRELWDLSKGVSEAKIEVL